VDHLFPNRCVVGRSALVVAHPGHELRVHGWLEQARPFVFVLTDGSGSTGHSRLASTRQVLRAAGATEGSIFGRMPDRQLYAAVVRREVGLFTSLAEELACSFLSLQIDVVVSDAREEYNSAHDLCWFLVEAAVTMAAHRRARELESFDFGLIARPDECPGGDRKPEIRLTLDDRTLERKLVAARGYPEMASELEVALRRFGAEAFRAECLGRADHDPERDWQPHGVPYYEQYGEEQVAAGLYSEVLRGDEHMVPLVAALRRYVRERTGCSPSPSS
jgi:hypothetical protein